ncbi:MAG TPA: zinc ribbon domain-containing protein [Macromonas sp.]|nr:zinc ribbon domain-containing protein [Macromonas sp.]
MPIHDYRCRACGAEFEALVRASSPPPVCPHCGADGLERLLSLPAAPGKTKAMIAAARRQAAKEGHFSNYSAAERGRT